VLPSVGAVVPAAPPAPIAYVKRLPETENQPPQ
jgi:hypothetical protein